MENIEIILLIVIIMVNIIILSCLIKYMNFVDSIINKLKREKNRLIRKFKSNNVLTKEDWDLIGKVKYCIIQLSNRSDRFSNDIMAIKALEDLKKDFDDLFNKIKN